MSESIKSNLWLLAAGLMAMAPLLAVSAAMVMLTLARGGGGF